MPDSLRKAKGNQAAGRGLSGSSSHFPLSTQVLPCTEPHCPLWAIQALALGPHPSLAYHVGLEESGPPSLISVAPSDVKPVGLPPVCLYHTLCADPLVPHGCLLPPTLTLPGAQPRLPCPPQAPSTHPLHLPPTRAFPLQDLSLRLFFLPRAETPPPPPATTFRKPSLTAPLHPLQAPPR